MMKIQDFRPVYRLGQLCPIQLAYRAKHYDTTLTMTADWMTY